MLCSTKPERIAFSYVVQNIRANCKISNVTVDTGNEWVTFDGFFRGKCTTCGHQIGEKVGKVFSVVVRKKDFKIDEKPDLGELK